MAGPNVYPFTASGKGGGHAQRGPIVSGADFIRGHQPPPWLIRGVVQAGRLYACTSLTGHGKTAVWLFNACMIMAGRMIGQLDTIPGNVLILAGENPSDLQARMIGMQQAYKLLDADLPMVLPGSFPLNDGQADGLEQDIAGLSKPLGLIIGDTASSFFPGEEENNNVQAGDYARILRRFNGCPGNPAVVALCHPVKNAGADNLLPRGGGAFLNELDGNLTLWSQDPGEVTQMHWQGKIRGPDFDRIGYKLRKVPTGYLDQWHEPELTIVAAAMDEAELTSHTKQTLADEDTVLRMLRDHPDWTMRQMAAQTGWVDGNGEPLPANVFRVLMRLREAKFVKQGRPRGPWEPTQAGLDAITRP